MRVEYHVEVDSTAERLWDVIADAKAWPEWQGTSYIEPPPGPLQTGTSFPVELGGMKWTVTVTEAERPTKLAWVGRRTGLKGVHEWEFVQRGAKTEAMTRETVSGWMLPLVYPVAKKKLPQTDEKWLVDLKARAETA
jgi:hypothetical protein